jgi:SWIM/SEC-C metal-binding protein
VSKPSKKNKPAIVRVQTQERAIEIYNLCELNGWKVIVGIEPDKEEDISDVEKLANAEPKPVLKLSVMPSKNAPCPCGSGKQYKRCCGN